MAASRALERGREGPQSVAAGTQQALQTIPALHWEKHNREGVWQLRPPSPTSPKKRKKVMSWESGDANWWLFKLEFVYLANVQLCVCLCVWTNPRKYFSAFLQRRGGDFYLWFLPLRRNFFHICPNTLLESRCRLTIFVQYKCSVFSHNAGGHVTYILGGLSGVDIGVVDGCVVRLKVPWSQRAVDALQCSSAVPQLSKKTQSVKTRKR